MKWEKVKLGDVCEITSSKRIFYSEYVDDGVPFYRSKEIIESDEGKIIENPLYISVDKYNEIKEKFGVPQTGDMLLTSVGTIGIPYIIKKKDCFYFKDGNLTWFRDFREGLNSKYLYYWIKSSEGTGTLYNTTIGSSQKALTISALKNIKVSLPPRSVQDKIVEVVSVYDDLIENNQKQIKLLEEAAQRLYKEWFVDLRFPGHENTKIVDGVPEEWRKFPLEEIAPVVTGKKDANYGDKGGNYPFFTCSQETITAPGYSFDTSAVILAGNGDFNVKLYRGKFEAYQRTYVLAPFDHSNLFNLYFTVQNNMEALAKGASGSTIKFLTKGMLQKILVLTADKKILDKFNDYEENIQQKVEALKKQVEDLTEIRNRLLPKLMSGEVEV